MLLIQAATLSELLPGLQLLAGNSYAVCAVATLGLALYGMRRRAA